MKGSMVVGSISKLNAEDARNGSLSARVHVNWACGRAYHPARCLFLTRQVTALLPKVLYRMCWEEAESDSEPQSGA